MQYRLSKIPDHIINLIVDKIKMRKELNAIIRKTGKIRKAKGLKQWSKKWSKLGNPNKRYYLIFSRYIGEQINIVPDNICHNYITPLLNPKRYISTYADKNMFDWFLTSKHRKINTPRTYIRCINGSLYDVDYRTISSERKIDDILKTETSIIIKPSIDGSSGQSILFFDKKDGQWQCRTHKLELSFDILQQEYRGNYIIQEVLKQSQFMANFCKTSVNTIRVAVYRSVKNNKSHILRSIIRIGRDGSYVDNAHAGGMFVGVDDNGKLGTYCCNQFGETTPCLNGINFQKEEYIIPNFDKVKRLAEEVSESIPHLRLLALDIMLDCNNNPVLIEYNVKAFSAWLFQFTSGTAFREYTDEIIDYCIKHKSEATRIFLSF